MRRGRATPKKSPPAPRGRLVFTVNYRDHADEWYVDVTAEGRSGGSYWGTYQYKKDAVADARNWAKMSSNRPSKLVVRTKSGKKSEVSRYD